jgi:hypothetical protein
VGAGVTLLPDLPWRTVGAPPANGGAANLLSHHNVLDLPARSVVSLVGLEQDAGVGQSPGEPSACGNQVLESLSLCLS